MPTLVTGTAGFIGYHAAERLLSRGNEVVGLDVLNDYDDVRWKEARLARLTPRPNYRPERVVHLAAPAGVRYALTNPHTYVKSNLVGFVHILEGYRHGSIEHLVDGPSASVYGTNTRLPFATGDVVEGVVRSVDRPARANPVWDGASPDPASSQAPYRLYDIGNNQPVELMLLIEVLERALGREAIKHFAPIRPGDVPATYADVDDLTCDVGFHPSTSIELGVERFVAWYRDYPGI